MDRNHLVVKNFKERKGGEHKPCKSSFFVLLPQHKSCSQVPSPMPPSFPSWIYITLVPFPLASSRLLLSASHPRLLHQPANQSLYIIFPYCNPFADLITSSSSFKLPGVSQLIVKGLSSGRAVYSPFITLTPLPLWHLPYSVLFAG